MHHNCPTCGIDLIADTTQIHITQVFKGLTLVCECCECSCRYDLEIKMILSCNVRINDCLVNKKSRPKPLSLEQQLKKAEQAQDFEKCINLRDLMNNKPLNSPKSNKV